LSIGARVITEVPLITEGHPITEGPLQIIIGLILMTGIGAGIPALLIEVVALPHEEVQEDPHLIEVLHTVDLHVLEEVDGGVTDIELWTR